MDKNKEMIDNLNHKISINERKNVLLTGIKKINSFDENEFYIDSVMGQIIVRGSNLELLKLDTFQGNLSIKGIINSVIYLEDGKKKSINKEGIIGRLFKW